MAVSIAETISGDSGSLRGRNLPIIARSGEIRNFSKFHWMSPASPGAWRRGERCAQGVPGLAVDVDLLEERERHAVGR